jgi:hypothetical protein
VRNGGAKFENDFTSCQVVSGMMDLACSFHLKMAGIFWVDLGVVMEMR